MAIQLDSVSKNYGKQTALNDVSFSLHTGEICGFLGPNGAGKSTTMKIITGYLTSFKGNVSICDTDLRQYPLQAKKLIGYLPEHNPLYPEMYIREYLIHVARLYRIPNPQKEVNEIIELTGLFPEIRKKIGQLSKGYRQRVGLAQALIHQPEVLILDEPMTGLDPNQLEEIRNLILRCGQNKTVLLSTHVMQEVEAICDRVLIINQGQIIADKSMEELQLQKENGMTIHIRFAPGTDTSWTSTSPIFGKALQISADTWQITSSQGTDPRVELFQAAALHQCPIIELKTEKIRLEEIFHELTQ